MYPKTLTPERQVSESGLRFLDPELGRWLGRDPIGEQWPFTRDRSVEGRADLHGQRPRPLYLFVENEPVARMDYLGLACWDVTIPIPVSQRRLGPARWLYFGSYFGGLPSSPTSCWKCWCFARRCRQMSQEITRVTYRICTSPWSVTEVSRTTSTDTLEICYGLRITVKNSSITSSAACTAACRAWVGTL